MKIYISLGIAILIILGGLAFWKYSPKKIEVKSVETVEQATTTTPSISINPIQQTVSISREDDSFKLISDVEKVKPGTTVKTGSSGRALVDSSSAHKTLLDYNSELVIKDDSQKEKKTKISLVSGAVWARLEKVFDSGEYYEVKTSNAVATVRGTSFGVWYSNHTTTIVVTEGSIFVSAIDEATTEVISGSEVVVTAGNKAIITKDGKIIISPITSSDKSSAWYKYNNPNDVIIPVKVPITTKTYPTPAEVIPSYVTPTSAPTPQPYPTPTYPTPATAFSIISFTPSTIVADPGASITVKGEGFTKLKSVIVGQTSVQNYTILSPTSIRIPVDQIPTGTYTINLIDLSNNIAQSVSQVTITAPQYPTPNRYPTPTTLQ